MAKLARFVKNPDELKHALVVRKKLRPLHQWVLIRKTSLEQVQTEAGLILDKSQARSSRGEVVAASSDVPLKPGDQVIFTNFPIELEDLEDLTGDGNLKLVRFEEIYAVIEDEKPEPQ